MKTISMWLMYSSLMGSILTIIILLIKRIFHERLGARWNYSIWFLLLIRMIIPYAPQTPFSIFNAYHYLQKLILKGNDSNLHGIGAIQQRLGNNVHADNYTNATRDYALSIDNELISTMFKIFFLIWIIGIIIYSIMVLTYNVRVHRRLKLEKYALDRNIVEIIEKCKDRMHIKSKFEAVGTTQFKSPAIFGVFNTFLLFPSNVIDKLSREEIEYITLHELAHYKRKDILINWISILLQIVHWYNPFIWYGFYKMRQDREIACDAYVLSYLKPEEYRRYGSTIITMVENISFMASVPLVTGFSNKKSHIKNRISMIASFNEKLNEIKPWKLMVCILLGCVLLTNGYNMPNTAFGMEMSKTPNNAEYIDLDTYFEGYVGSFVMVDMKENKYEIYNKAKSQKRISPYSTFKIIIALSGLEHGILEDDNSKMKWDGYPYPIEPWNKDHTLSSAMRYSVNWYFEKVSEGIGISTLKNDIDKLEYGNKNISGGITKFWMQSSLKISPIEQVDILKGIYNYEVPFSRRSIDVVKEALKISKEGDAALSGKTGSGNINNKAVNGWFVGYLEKPDNVYFFVVNIEGEDNADGVSAREIALSILSDKGLY